MRYLHIVPLCAVILVVLAATPHYAAAPTTYSLTDRNSMSAPETETIYRDGDIVTTDTVWAPINTATAHMPHGKHLRVIYNLRNRTGWSWNVADASVPCMAGFGTWGDPFQWMSQIFGGEDVSQLHPRRIGAETIAGRPSTIYELAIPGGGKVRIWRDDAYGLLLKMESPGSGGRYETGLEVTQFSLARPPASTFVPPARCPRRQ